MRGPFRQQVDRWLLGATSASVQGGATAVKAFMGLAMANAVGLQVPTLNLQQGLYVFAFAALYHFWDYLAGNPLSNLARPAETRPLPPTPPISPVLAEQPNNPPGPFGQAQQETRTP